MTKGEKNARMYMQSRIDAIRTIESRINDECRFERLPAFYYTERKANLDAIRENFGDAHVVICARSNDSR